MSITGHTRIVLGAGIATGVLLAACIERPLEPLNPCLVSTLVEQVEVSNVDKVDLLFVVDNSKSMQKEQAALRREFPKLIRALTTGEPGVESGFTPAKDLHLAVVSSDMGLAGVSGVPGCARLGDDGIMNGTPGPTAIGCDPTYPPFLTYLAGVSEPERTASDFACIAALGTDGCGFEQPLEAALKALWPSVDIDPVTGRERTRIRFLTDEMGLGGVGHGDLENAGFLRNDASDGLSVVAIVVVTDEEDCSSADTSHLVPDEYLPLDSPLRAQDLNLRCFHNPHNLYGVERYADAFRALRPGREDLVLFATIAGVPPDLVDASARRVAQDAYYARILDDPRMRESPDPSLPPGEGNLTPSCDTVNGAAYPPRRLVELAREFGERGTVQSICQDDFGPAMDTIIELIRNALPRVCLPRPLVRDGDGLVNCNVVWELPPPGTAPPGTPTSCSERSYLGAADAGRRATTDAGGQVCNVHQLAVAGDRPSTTAGLADGWYYDDFDPELGMACGETPQRIAFTQAARPGTGVTVKLECLNETQRLATGDAHGPATARQPSIGDACDAVTTASGQVLHGDAACVRTLADGAQDASMFCHAELNVCVLGCTTHADCPPAWSCDTRAETVSTGSRAMCVNPTCGGAR